MRYTFALSIALLAAACSGAGSGVVRPDDATAPADAPVPNDARPAAEAPVGGNAEVRAGDATAVGGNAEVRAGDAGGVGGNAEVRAGDATAVDGAAGGAADQAGAPVVCQGRVLEASVVNARDLGGVALATGGQVACRRVLRGGALTRLDSQGCDEFAALGIRTILDLREASVQGSQPPPACATGSARHAPAAMPKLLPDTPANYLALLDETAAVRAAFAVFGDAGAYPVYLHCEIGRDRASFVTALILLAAGADDGAVMDEFALSASAGVAVKPECMRAVLDEIARRGGIESYLLSAGVPAAALAVVRAEARRQAR
jgi:hypothetical protein